LPAFYRGILRSAELTGRLDTVLDQLSVYIDRDLETRRKIKGALIYPCVVLVMAAGTVVVLSTYVLPKFKDFFASLDAKLPLPTRMLLGFTRFLAVAWLPMVLGFAAIVLLGFLASRTARGQYVRDRILLRLPAIGETVRYVIVERYCRILSSMVTAGVSLTDSLVVARDSLHNRVFERRLNEAYETVLEGGGLAAPLVKTQLFPATVTQMVRVGEETGSLDTQLTVAAEFFERELDYKIKRMTALFEPAVILVAGAIVGFVAIALVSAMYGIFRTAHLS
jgi:type IV pilus assembly protein PilC